MFYRGAGEAVLRVFFRRHENDRKIMGTVRFRPHTAVLKKKWGRAKRKPLLMDR